MRTLTLVTRGLSALAVCSLLFGGGCSLLVDTSATQCSTTEDCLAQGPAFSDTECDAVKRACIPRKKCESNVACTQAAGGAASICRSSDRRCVPVLTEDCREILGSLDADGTLLVGSMLPLTGTLADVGVPVQRSMDLAVKELNSVGAGLPIGGAGRRPLAIVKCDEGTDPLRAASHLVKDLEVPAILGPFSSGVALKVAPQVSVPAGTLLLSPGATAPSLNRVSSGKLVWRTAASDVHQARALSQVIPVTEAEHRIAWEIPDPPDGLIKVAMVVRGDSYGIELAQAMIESGVSFNGKSLSANGTFFERHDYGDPAADPNVDFTPTVDALVKLKPNIVIMLTGAEGASRVVVPLEKSWPAGVAKPWYVLAHGARTPSLLEVAKVDDDLRRRMRGTIAGRGNAQFDAFELAYRGAYDQASANVYGMAQAYDALYLLAYGIVGGGAPVTGSSVSAGLAKMSSGPVVTVGPGPRISDAFDLLNRGQSITFVGAAGTYNFDPATGDAPFDVDVWCIGKGADGAPVFQASGQYYDATQRSLVGAFKCD